MNSDTWVPDAYQTVCPAYDDSQFSGKPHPPFPRGWADLVHPMPPASCLQQPGCPPCPGSATHWPFSRKKSSGTRKSFPFSGLKMCKLEGGHVPSLALGSRGSPSTKDREEAPVPPRHVPVPPRGLAAGSYLVPFDSLKTDVFPCWFHSGCFLSHTIKRSLRSINSHFRIASFCAALGSKLIYHEKPYSFSQALALSSSCRDQLLGCEPCSF